MICNEVISHMMSDFNVVVKLLGPQRSSPGCEPTAEHLAQTCEHQQHSHLFTHKSDSCTQRVTPADKDCTLRQFLELVNRMTSQRRRLWLQMMSLLQDDSTGICKLLASFSTQWEEVGMCHHSATAYQLIK